jgi:Holliday junction resolvase RusA-like endonuclease
MAEVVWRATIHGNPGDAAVNRAKRAIVRKVPSGGKGASKPKARVAQIKSKRARMFEARAAESLNVARIRDQAGYAAAQRLAHVGVTITAYWPRRRHLADGSGLIALGDVDAPAKAVLDALERAGVVDDDARVMELVARKRVDSMDPRIEIEVWSFDTRGVVG